MKHSIEFLIWTLALALLFFTVANTSCGAGKVTGINFELCRPVNNNVLVGEK